MRLEAGSIDIASVAANPDLQMRQLTSKERELHVSIASAGFDAPAALFEELVSEPLFALPGFRAYVGSSHDEPVTTALAMTEKDHVGVYNVATLPAHRGRGYGAAVTAQAVLDGFASGASFAVLQSSDAGFAVYQRLGFRTVESWESWIVT